MITIRLVGVLWIALGAITPIHAQKKPEERKPGDEMIEKYLAAKTAELSKKVLDGATTLAEWEQKRPRLKQEYLYMLGLWPLPEKTPLHATVTGILERDGVVIEKPHFQSKPGLYVTGNLYRPKKSTGKLPAVLYVCGHANRGRDGNKTADHYQDHPMWFASNGYVCLSIDTLQLGEIPGVHHGTYGRPYNHLKAYGVKEEKPPETRWWWHAAGYTPAGVECWNGIRALDYLVSRPDVDADRLTVTGISGGGAATFWIAAADERVQVAVPISGMSDLESYVTNKVIDGHCDCMFLYNTFQWEWTTIAALVAPRPLLFANSDNDRIFPMDGNRRVIERLRKLYTLYGKPELVDEYVSQGGHAYRPDLRVAIFKWINKHVKGDAGPVKDSAEFKPLPGKELRVFAEDKDIPKDAINGKVDEVFVPRAQVRLPEAGRFEEWRKELLKQLRERSFRTFPEQIRPSFESVRTWYPLILQIIEPGVPCEYAGYAMGKPIDRTSGVLIVSSEVNVYAKQMEWARSYWGEGLVASLSPRGRGAAAWTQRSPPNYVERSHILLGRTVDQGCVFDIAGLVNGLHEESKGKRNWKVVGRGQDGILAAYAALFEPSISEVVVVDPPTSHRDGPYFLNVLRVLDIPEALGLLAPRKLTLVNAKDKAFDRTAEIYKLAGAADKLERK